MKLATNIAIDYSAGVGTIGNGIVEGRLQPITFMPDGSITAAYNYMVNDAALIIKSGTMTIPAEDVQAMYNAVKAGLPSIGTDFNGHLKTAFYKAFINEMVTTFSGLDNASQVDLVS